MCHTLLEIPKKRANINHWLLFMKVINVSLSALLLVARFGEGSLLCLLHRCVRIAPLTSLSPATSLSSAFCHLVRKYDITLPFDPHSQESADWMIGLERTSTLTLNSILLMSGAISNDDMRSHTRADRTGQCVCWGWCTCAYSVRVCVCVWSCWGLYRSDV